MRFTSLSMLVLSCWAAGAFAAEPFDIRNKDEFAKIVPEGAKVERLATDMKFTEGPCWMNDAGGGFLVFSDIPSNEIKRWGEKDGLGVFRAMSNGTNGNFRDAEGRLLSC